MEIYGIRSTNTPQDHLSSRVAYLLMWAPTLRILPDSTILTPRNKGKFPADNVTRLLFQS